MLLQQCSCINKHCSSIGPVPEIPKHLNEPENRNKRPEHRAGGGLGSNLDNRGRRKKISSHFRFFSGKKKLFQPELNLRKREVQ